MVKIRDIYSIICKNYKEFKKSKILYICYKTLLLSNSCNKRGIEDKQIFIEEKSIKILQFIGLITHIEVHQKIYNHTRINQEFRPKKQMK